ncbi:HAD family hydrolase [Streptomyces novaecaesareae]|uniref:HAD family hydrolase n=1 Tax=Streptomyces novaecaesareae TaxID=68244 RepID=UPI000998A0E9|nr:HAD family phosphatase [Streptomyces novaecaesareae]
MGLGDAPRAGLPLPTVQVYGEDVLNAKPHPEPYLPAAARLGIEPAQCVVVEDAPAGITAAKAAGCTVIGITTTHEATQLLHADAHASSLTDLKRHLLPLLQEDPGHPHQSAGLSSRRGPRVPSRAHPRHRPGLHRKLGGPRTTPASGPAGGGGVDRLA